MDRSPRFETGPETRAITRRGGATGQQNLQLVRGVCSLGNSCAQLSAELTAPHFIETIKEQSEAAIFAQKTRKLMARRWGQDISFTQVRRIATEERKNAA